MHHTNWHSWREWLHVLLAELWSAQWAFAACEFDLVWVVWALDEVRAENHQTQNPLDDAVSFPISPPPSLPETQLRAHVATCDIPAVEHPTIAKASTIERLHEHNNCLVLALHRHQGPELLQLERFL